MKCFITAIHPISAIHPINVQADHIITNSIAE